MEDPFFSLGQAKNIIILHKGIQWFTFHVVVMRATENAQKQSPLMFEKKLNHSQVTEKTKSKSIYLQDMLKENKVALEMDKYCTDNELGTFAEAVTKTQSQNKH